MLAKRIAAPLAVLIAAVAVSAPALAERGHRDQRHVQHYPTRYHPVAQRAVVHHYYRPAPRPVVVVHRPAPVVYHQAPRPHSGAAIVFGAILGAAIAHTVITAY